MSNSTKSKKERVYLTAVTIECGIITLINEDGEIAHYRQRGIQRIDAKKRQLLIGYGFLHRNWNSVPELPSNYSICFEDEFIQGKARASYPNPDKLLEALTGKRIH